jgi:hypothetical protein
MSAGRKIITDNKEWNTPKKFLSPIKTVFYEGIDLDPCSNKYSIIDAKNCFILPKDGLLEDWNYKTIFVNPPYGYDKNRRTSIKDWIIKCSTTFEKYNNEIMALIPVATNTIAWKEYIFKTSKAICFLNDTRLKFLEKGIENKKGAPMACAIIYWGHRKLLFHQAFLTYGKTIYVNI